MKRIMCFATALTVAMTAFTTLASAAKLSSYADDPEGFELEKNKFDVPKEDYVRSDIDSKIKWSNQSAYITDSLTYSATTGTNKIDAYTTLDMSKVAAEWNAIIDTVVNKGISKSSILDRTKITGSFTIKIKAPKQITNEAMKSDPANAYTWSDKVKEFFVEAGTPVYDATENTFTINMKLKDDVSNNALDAFYADVNNSDNIFALTIPSSEVDTTASSFTYRVDGEFSGSVAITLSGATEPVSTVYFGDGTYTTTTVDSVAVRTNNPSKDSVTVRRTSGGGGGGGGGGSSSRVTPAPTTTDEPTTAPTTSPTPVPTAVPEDKIQTGRNSRGAALNMDDHYAYIIGYPIEDGSALAEVRPEASITRAEVATIFFRLLTDESRVKFWKQDNSFSDVAPEDWFNNAVSTVENAGVIEGSEGKFRPNDAITRAEFATIAARFSSIVYDGDDKFTDISGHWARESINKAAETGWINGYGDTFRPDNKITRAEAMTLVNRMLYRLVDNESLEEEGMLVWVDNMDTSVWYYANVQEATNSHNYKRTAIGYIESWTETKAPREWVNLEKETSDAYSAGKEDSVFKDSGLEELETEQSADAKPVETEEEADEADAAEEAEAEVTEE